MKDGAFEICGYSYYFHAGTGQNIISKALENKDDKLLVCIPREILLCFSDYEKSNEKEKFLGFYALEFSGFFQTFNQKGSFLFYLISLLYMLKCTKAGIFIAENDCVLEFPEKEINQTANYRQTWDMTCYRDLDSFSREIRLEKITVQRALEERNFLFCQEQGRFSIYTT